MAWVALVARLLAHSVQIVAGGNWFHPELTPDWSYAPTPSGQSCGDGTNVRCGPNRWADQHADCGKAGTQSPINAPFKTAIEQFDSSASDLVLTNPTACTTADFELNAHTTEVKLGRTCPGAFVATWRGKPFNLLQYHWHSPSEHTIDGRYYAMEAHHVFQSPVDGQFLVLAVVIDACGDGNCPELACAAGATSPECSRAEFFDAIQEMMPAAVGSGSKETSSKTTRRLSGSAFQHLDVGANVNPIAGFIPAMDTHFYYYNGSFTTPACDANVVWILNPTLVTIFDSSLQFYRKLINSYPDNQLYVPPSFNWSSPIDFTWNFSLGSNNRPTQAISDESEVAGLREFFVVGRKPPAPWDSSASSSADANSLESSMSGSMQLGEPISPDGSSGFASIPFPASGSSGSYMEVWKWIVMSIIIMCCLGTCAMVMLCKTGGKKRGKRKTTLSSARDDINEDEAAAEDDEGDELPSLVPLIASTPGVVSYVPLSQGSTIVQGGSYVGSSPSALSSYSYNGVSTVV